MESKDIRELFYKYDFFYILNFRKLLVLIENQKKVVKEDFKESEKFKESIDILIDDLGRSGKRFERLLKKGYFIHIFSGNYMYFAKHQEKTERLNKLFECLDSNLRALDELINSD